MAKTAQDYIYIGRGMAVANFPRPAGNSWQAKAQQQGFDSVVNESSLPNANECNEQQPPIGAIPAQFKKTPGIGQDSVEVLECHPVAHNPQEIQQHAYHAKKSTQRKQSTVNAVQSHIDALYTQAIDSNKSLAYAHKLGVKIQKIVDRWAKKGITFYVNKTY